jgi:hypothetical protein
MTSTRVQVTLKTVDANPENYVTNSWCVDTFSGAINTTATTTTFKDFYDDLPTSSLSSAIAQNGHVCKFYALPGSAPNYPFAETTFNLAAAPTGVAIPSECAVVLSFQGTRQAGFPQARRRGRVYLGPWGANANTAGRPSTTVLTSIANAATTLSANLQAQTPVSRWAIWSTSDGAMVYVDNGWVDNAWDTQRRRGLAYTSRTTFIA